MNDVLARVRAHLGAHFAAVGVTAEPTSASVTFLGLERMDVLRFGSAPGGGYDYVSLGCSRYPMADPTAVAADPLRGQRAEVLVRLRDTVTTPGLARAVALLAATPAVEGVILRPDALIDLGSALWEAPPGTGVFSAFLLEPSDIDDLELDPPCDPVCFLRAVPITATEAAWVRLKGADALRAAWAADGVDITDVTRPAGEPAR